MVFDHQHAQAGGVGVAGRGLATVIACRAAVAVSGGNRVQGQTEPEAGALSGAAVDTDAAAHGFDEAFADGQPQAGAAVVPCAGVVDLRKRFEEQGLLRG